MKNSELRQGLRKLYEGYEDKIISEEEILIFVRDFYYYEVTGKSYEEWAEIMKALKPWEKNS